MFRFGRDIFVTVVVFCMYCEELNAGLWASKSLAENMWEQMPSGYKQGLISRRFQLRQGEEKEQEKEIETYPRYLRPYEIIQNSARRVNTANEHPVQMKYLAKSPNYETVRKSNKTLKDHLRSSRLRISEDGAVKTTTLKPEPKAKPEDVKEEKQNKTHDEVLSPYNVVNQMMKIINATKLANVNVTTTILDRTVSYNDIVLFKIVQRSNEAKPNMRANNKYVDDAPEKKIIFIVHGLTTMGLNSLSCLHEQEQLTLLVGYYLSHLDKFDIFLIPIANPDGYIEALASKNDYISVPVFWNKNKSPQGDCGGVMLDRNFDVAWNSSGANISPCSQQYPGPSPFSEVETQAIRDVFHYYGHKIIGYIHVHGGTYDTTSFKGDAILYPQGYTDVQMDDDHYVDLRGEVDEAMKNASFQVMSVTVDTLYSWYGGVSGSSVDYASSVYGIPFAVEFVMQPFENDQMASQEKDMADYVAVTQLWRRLIDVVFNYIWKNIDGNADAADKSEGFMSKENQSDD